MRTSTICAAASVLALLLATSGARASENDVSLEASTGLQPLSSPGGSSDSNSDSESSTGDPNGAINWAPPVLSTDSWGKNTLSPICSSGGWSLPINTTTRREINIASSAISTTILFFDCFSYLRLPYPSTETCWNATKQVQVLVDIISNVTGEVRFTVPLTDIYGGSVSALSWVLPEKFLFRMYVNIPHTLTEFPAGCSAELQLSFPSRLVAKPTPVVDQAGPRLLHAEPFVLEKGKEAIFSFAVNRHPRDLTFPDQFYLASVPRGCWAGPGTALDGNARATVYSGGFPAYFAPYANETTEAFARWRTVLPSHGHFFLCAIPAGFNAMARPGIEGVEIGYIEVFGGNPALYSMMGSHSSIYLDQQYTFVFEGTALDLRPGHDQAKLINAAAVAGKPDPSCVDQPGLGTEVGSDLGPGDDVGQHVKIAYFNFTVKTSGSFFVCYQRYNTAWIRVYPLEYAAPHSRSYLKNLTNLDPYHSDATFAPQRTDYTPTPTKPTGGWTIITDSPGAPSTAPVPAADSQWCTSNNLFTYNQEEEVGDYVTLHFNNKSDINFNLVETLGFVLCLSTNIIYLTLPQLNVKTNTWSTEVELDCIVGKCDASDRLQYLAWLYTGGKNTDAASKLLAAGAIAGGGTNFDGTATSMGSSSDDEGTALMGVILVMLIVILVLVVVFVIVMVVKKRKKKQPAVAATNRPAGGDTSDGGAAAHRNFQYGGGHGNHADFDDVVAGIPMDSMDGTSGRPLPPRPGMSDDDGHHGAPRQEYDVEVEGDESNEALPAVEVKECAPVPVYPRR